ncbi:DUF4743 domain-containing protein [Pelagibius sp. CAU 1746]|uniref:NUDIX hydrolase n=1 Tax=Pelagibius sp. CAU 1746 TaxID=3140370 RepID=UPI00325B0896
MSFLDRIRACHRWRADDYLPFLLDGDPRPLGWVTPAFAARLRDFPEVFDVTEAAVCLAPRLGDFESRSAALKAVLEQLHGAGEIPAWRGEDYGICRRWDDEVIFKMERGAVPLFGVPAYGIHVNGFVRTPEGPRLWVGRRSRHKALAPGKLDHLVAGGQPYGLSLMENVVKEAAEEASVPEDLARRARPVGALGYLCARPEGQRNDVLFVYDLELPADFVPTPNDDEVEEFFLWPMEKILERLKDSDDFKFNVALVNLDFALRHGVLTPDAEPGYQAIAEGLQGRLTG